MSQTPFFMPQTWMFLLLHHFSPPMCLENFWERNVSQGSKSRKSKNFWGGLVNALGATIGLTRSPDAISPHVCGIIVTR